MASLPTDFGAILNAAKRWIDPYTPGVDKEIRRVAATHLRHLRKAHTAAIRGSRRQTRGRVYWISNSPGSKLVACLLSRSKGSKKATLQELQNRAGRVNLRKPSGEHVRCYLKDKPDGGKRPITGFGQIARANRLFIQHILQTISPPSEFEFCRRGLGREAAIRNVLHDIKHKGVRYLGLADVKNHFPSHDRQGVIKFVPLPRAMVEHNILVSPHDPINIHHDALSLISAKTVRAGLPHGSPPSAFVAAKILEESLRKVQARSTTAFVDNSALGGKTMVEAQAKQDALASHLEEHPAGPFRLRDTKIVRLGDVSDFLGYWFRHQAPPFGGFGRVTPSKKSIHRAQRRLLAKLILLPVEQFDPFIETWATEWALRYPCWGSRHAGGPIAAYIGAMHYVHPVAKKMRKVLLAKHSKSKSFGDLQAAAAELAQLLPPDPSYQNLSTWGNKSAVSGKCLKQKPSNKISRPSFFPFHVVTKRYV